MSYQNQLMDPMGTYRFIPDLYNLNGIQKKVKIREYRT